MEASSFDEVDLCGFHIFENVLGFRPGIDGSRGPKETFHLGTFTLLTGPGGLPAWVLGVSMKWICVDFMDLRMFLGFARV